MQARVSEAERTKENGGLNADGKRMSARPDVKARTQMCALGKCVNTAKAAGHVPGIKLGARYVSKT